jgi:acetylornithine deacetylase/succinyl-diaminopimelate desuccinylase-like protein
VILLAVSDEETGGSQGMGWLVENRLNELAPGIVWDEGGLGLKGVFGDGVFFGVAVAEKQIQHLRVVARGQAGHGSMPHDDNANVHLMRALERILAPRPVRVNEVTRAMFAEIAATQTFPRSFLLRHLGNRLIRALVASALTGDKLTNAMVRDTISLTMLESGYKVNVIPDRAEAAIDCRLLPDTDVAAFRRDLETAAGDDAIVEEIETSPPTAMSPVDGAFVRAVRGAVAEHLDQALVAPLQMPGGSDARFFRQRGIPAYGFAPFVLTRDELDRVHGVDERISIENLRLGVAVAKGIIRRLCVEDEEA